MIFTKYHTLLVRKLGKMSQNMSTAAVVIGALRAKIMDCLEKCSKTRFVMKVDADLSCILLK